MSKSNEEIDIHLKLEKVDIPNYVPKEGDITEEFQQHEVNFGYCSVVGNDLIHHEEQQDYIVFGTEDVNLMPQMDEKLIEESLKRTFKTLDSRNSGIESRKVGTTCCSATGWISSARSKGKEVQKLTVWTASLGDSVAFLLRVKENGTLIVEALNPDLHDPRVKKEKKRIREFNEERRIDEKTALRPWILEAELSKGRLGKLGVTGVFGDKGPVFGDIASEDCGVTHEPYITRFETLLEKGEKAFILAASNGYTKKSDFDPLDGTRQLRRFIGGEIKRQIKSQGKMKSRGKVSLSKISEKMVQDALNNFSKDNITVGLGHVQPGKPCSITVLDGHGSDQITTKEKRLLKVTGRTIAEKIGKDFYPTLKNELESHNKWLNIKSDQIVALALEETEDKLNEKIQAITSIEQESIKKAVRQCQIANIGKIFHYRVENNFYADNDSVEAATLRQGAVARNLLQDIRTLITDNLWKVGKFQETERTKRQEDENGNVKRIYPRHVVEMLAVINKTLDENPVRNTGCFSSCWRLFSSKPKTPEQLTVDALQKVLNIGKRAARKKPCSIGGLGRDKGTQAFYDLFKDASFERPRPTQEVRIRRSSSH